MKFKIYKENGALNSKPVFDAFEQGINRLGYQIVQSQEDIPVIWSVLWQGRMKSNRQIYENAIKLNKPIIIIEVGNLKRGITWRISVDHVNRNGYFGNEKDLDSHRIEKLNVHLHPERTIRKDQILIACQHRSSLQWQDMPPTESWIRKIVDTVKQYSDRKIVVRPHPRSPLSLVSNEFEIKKPQKILETYDDFDIKYNFHCVINHNSGPSVQSAINGTPTICDISSLAYPVSSTFEQIENVILPDRSKWFIELAHTEWTLEEIASGMPLSRLIDYLKLRLGH
jgi:hypothetical protein